MGHFFIDKMNEHWCCSSYVYILHARMCTFIDCYVFKMILVVFTFTYYCMLTASFEPYEYVYSMHIYSYAVNCEIVEDDAVEPLLLLHTK